MKFAVVTLALLLLAGCREEARTDETPPVRPVLSVVAEMRTSETLGPYAGSIQPRYSTDVAFRVFGRMVARFADVGAFVKKGQALAALDPAVQLIQVRNAEASVANAEAQFANARAEEQRQKPLVERNITPQATFDLLVQNRETAEANLTRARASLKRAEDALSYTQLRADYDGVVTARYAEPGQVLNPGQKVLTIARPEIREGVFSAPNELAELLGAPGAFEIVVRVDPHTAMRAASIRSIDPAADPITRTRTVYLTLNDPSPAYRLGTTIDVRLTRPIAPRIELPATALLERDGKIRVWVVAPATGASTSTVALRDVTVGARKGGSVDVTAGLEAGERVVIAGVHSLAPGQTVKIDGASK